jgi:hypothetical protein
MKFFLAAILLLSATSTSLFADLAIYSENFETSPPGPLPNWIHTNGYGDAIVDFGVTANGSRAAFFDIHRWGTGPGDGAASIKFVDTLVAYIPNTQYKLNFDGYFTGTNHDYTRDQSLTYEVWAGSPVGGGLLLGSGNLGPSFTNGGVELTTNATSSGAGSLYIRFATVIPSYSPSGTDYMQAEVDNIVLTQISAVPEPTTLALLATGFSVVAMRARRSRNS